MSSYFGVLDAVASVAEIIVGQGIRNIFIDGLDACIILSNRGHSLFIKADIYIKICSLTQGEIETQDEIENER